MRILLLLGSLQVVKAARIAKNKIEGAVWRKVSWGKGLAVSFQQDLMTIPNGIYIKRFSTITTF